MIIKENEILSPYTSFKIGGSTPKMFIPESVEELIGVIKKLNLENKNYYILGNGTNILINGNGVKEYIVNNRKACDFINFFDNGEVEAGSSCNTRRFIKMCVEKNLAAFTDLISIPGSIGGAICMNAGKGGGKVSVSDNIVDVKFFDGDNIKTINKDNCRFGYRYSIFQKKKDWIIISAKFKFGSGSREIGEKRIYKRMEEVKNKTYFKFNSAGSIFKNYNYRIMALLKGLKIGGAQYSGDDLNSILNLGKATFKDVIRLINIAKFLHFIFFKKSKLEIKIWN